MTGNRVSADELSLLIDICGIPRRKHNWHVLRPMDKHFAKGLEEKGLIELDSVSVEDVARPTASGREVVAAMYAAAHKLIFGEDCSYRG